MITEEDKQAACKLRELAHALEGLNQSKTDGGQDDLLDAIPRLWIEAWIALTAINFQPPADMRRIEPRRAGAAWLRAIALELDGRDTA